MILRIEKHKDYELKQIFQIIEKLVWDDCGDGDCSILSKNHTKLANLYDKYRQETFGKSYIKEEISDSFLKTTYILFSDQSNESLSFHDINKEFNFATTNKVYIDGEI